MVAPKPDLTIFDALYDERPGTLGQVVLGTDFWGVDLLPGDEALARIQVENIMASEARLKNAAEGAGLDQYDVMLLDMPPALGRLTLNGLIYANEARIVIDYFVNGQQLHGLARVNGECSTLPGLRSRGRLNVAASDSHDIWLDGSDDANHPNPFVFGCFLLVGPPVAAFALWTELTDYRGVRRLIASCTPWWQIQATVTTKTAKRSDVTIGSDWRLRLSQGSSALAVSCTCS